jgi:hypothetical protein
VFICFMGHKKVFNKYIFIQNLPALYYGRTVVCLMSEQFVIGLNRRHNKYCSDIDCNWHKSFGCRHINFQWSRAMFR